MALTEHTTIARLAGVGKGESTAAIAGLLPFLPMLYIAWADGILTGDEWLALQKRVREQSWLDEPEKQLINRFLDPASPPEPLRLNDWLTVIREAAATLPEAHKMSLAALGLEMARLGASSASERCTSPAACAALEELESALGVIGPEATRALLGTAAPAPATPPASAAPTVDIHAIQHLLDGKFADVRHRLRQLLATPGFRHEYGLDNPAYRERVLQWCRQLAAQGFGAISYPVAYGGEGNLAKFVAAFETIAFHDLSLAIKFGVQFGLFGGSILNLGTEKHHRKYLQKVGSLEWPGCFAMTELGHGSNVRDLETTATFDPATHEFVIDTPTDSARKEFIGNAAAHGRLATVFAQLIAGGEQFGVHAFIVPIRDAKGRPMPGVRLEDCGEKMGLNGVDNGRIWFSGVRIPQENLLNRFGNVDAAGRYTSPIPSPSARFFTMLGTLVGGRISVAAAALSAAKSALAIAIHYAEKRRQFGRPGERETLLLDYPAHQRRLLPRLAAAFACDFALKHLVQRYVNRNQASDREVEGLAAALKSYTTWFATKTIQVCREACGGQGYLAVNRFAALKADTDVFATFEGDNTVLLQLVAKGLLTEFKHHFEEMKFLGMVKYISSRASTALAELNPIITRTADQAHLRDPEFHLAAMRYREHDLLVSVARRLRHRIENGMDSFDAFNACQDHLINLARAHAERVILEQFLDGIPAAGSKTAREVLQELAALFALWRIERDKGWFLENGYIEGNKAKAIRQQVEKLCAEIRPVARGLTEAFGIPEAVLAAPIAVR